VVDIISKKDGPRREDVAARRLIDENKGTIRQMMNHLAGGQLDRLRQQPAEPKAEGLIIHAGSAGVRRSSEEPYVRISPNGRVVVADLGTNRQLNFLGELRGPPRSQRFVLATKANGFFAVIEDELGELLGDLDDREVAGEFSEDDLIATISDRLGLGASEEDEPAADR